jgi:fatty-acid desaturase
MKFLISNTAALPWIQITLTILMILFAVLFPQSAVGWLSSVLMYVCIGCFGISIGYHRLLTHKSFKTSKFWEDSARCGACLLSREAALVG